MVYIDDMHASYLETFRIGSFLILRIAMIYDTLLVFQVELSSMIEVHQRVLWPHDSLRAIFLM